MHDEIAFGSGESPVGAAVGVENPPVLLELGNRAWRSVRFEIGRRGHQHAPARRHSDRDQPAVAHRPGPDHCVVAGRLHIDETIVEVERQLYSRMLLEEWIECWSEVQIAKTDGP